MLAEGLEHQLFHTVDCLAWNQAAGRGVLWAGSGLYAWSPGEAPQLFGREAGDGGLFSSQTHCLEAAGGYSYIKDGRLSWRDSKAAPEAMVTLRVAGGSLPDEALAAFSQAHPEVMIQEDGRFLMDEDRAMQNWLTGSSGADLLCIESSSSFFQAIREKG